ncbi:MFS transporter [Chromobacterium haemolyticum]|uniref:MFS transporter n=1 Tax=Chromobacterium haemolyticum TaxID=394935 RepID=UPI00307E73C7
MTIVTMTSVSGFFATDIFLPAIPAMQIFYGKSKIEMQLLISIFLYALATSQLIYGPISDAIGRRWPLLFALGAYVSASFTIPQTNDFNLLLGLRAVQGIGACGAIVIGRAVIGDLYSGVELQRFFLSMSIIVGLSPAFAPVFGQGLYTLFDWKACFYFTGFFGVLIFAAVYFMLCETREVKPFEWHFLFDAISKYRVALHSSGFKWGVAIISISQSAYFAYLSESAFLLQSQHFPLRFLGYSYVSLSIAYVIGNVCARHLASKVSSTINFTCGFTAFAFACVFISLGLFIAPYNYVVMIIGMSILTFANGFLLPLGTAAAIGAVPAYPGSASGLAGFCQLFCSAIAAQLVGIVTEHRPVNFGFFILLLGIANCGLYFFKVRLQLAR